MALSSMFTTTSPAAARPRIHAAKVGELGCRARASSTPPRPAAEPAAFGGRVPDSPYVCLGEGLFGEERKRER